MLEDTRLKIFETVAAMGSFTKAAKALGLTQPAISQRIAELEGMLGDALFIRAHGSVSLTPKGEEFRTYVQQILYWYKAAEDVFLKGGQNTSAPATVDLDPYTALEIFSSQGDIHIRMKKKHNL